MWCFVLPLITTGSTDVFRMSSLVLNVSVIVLSGGVAAVRLTGGRVWILKQSAQNVNILTQYLYTEVG